MPKRANRKSTPEAIMSVLASLPDQHRAGLPARDSIVGVTTPAGGSKYTVIHTNELDAYEAGAKGPKFAATAAAALPAGDDYNGTARKAAKLSISAAKTETFKDIQDLIKSLTAESKMIAHKPPIATDATSNRVAEEQRNVHVSAFMYAASREADNDFHLIIGRDPKLAPEMYMTMELSGLPPASSPSFKQLKAARDAFKNFFKTHLGSTLPGLTYDFYQPPIPVQIDGSLFFDMTHAQGSHPGPPSLKSRMPVIWELHPITVFKA
jgi:SepF-like predicted cell division protein (DUF552 family)